MSGSYASVLAAIVAGLMTFTSLESCGEAAATAGGLGIVGAIAVYASFASAVGIDLTGMLGAGFYLYGLASLVLFAVGAAGIWNRLSPQGAG